MPDLVLDYHSPTTKAARPLMSWIERSMLIALGIILPLVCFGISLDHYPAEPDWQTGTWYAPLLFIPNGRAGYPFFPLLIYCMVCLGTFVIRPATARYLLVRLGLHTGIIVALQYSCIQALVAEREFIIVLVIGLCSNFVLLGVIKLLELIPRKWLGWGIGVVTSIAALYCMNYAVIQAHGFKSLGVSFFVVGFVCVILAPVWCVGVYGRATLLAMRANRGDERNSTPLIFSWIAWLGAYAVAWKLSVTNALAMYAALPAQAPHCYIATAAAAGHRGFVGSALVHAADGSIFPANQQLRRLKCVEIAVAAACPRLHRFIRRIYDRSGPPLARTIAPHPLAADIAFALLKPIEWIAFGLLILLTPEARATARRLYPLK